MTKSELHNLVDRVRKRHNRRIVLVVTVMLVLLFGGLTLVSYLYPDPDAKPQRTVFVYAVAGLSIVVGGVGGSIIFHLAKADCFSLGVVCPFCGLHLYSRRRLVYGGAGIRETGICPHCKTQLVDNWEG